MGVVKDSLKSAVKEIDQQLISISENQILLRNEPFKASMVSYFDSQRLSSFIENAVLPIVSQNRIQIVTKDKAFVIHLLSKLEDNNFQSKQIAEFLQFLKLSLTNSFIESHSKLTEDTLRSLLQIVVAQDQSVAIEISNLHDPLLASLVQPYLALRRSDPFQEQAADLIEGMEIALIKPKYSPAYTNFLKSLSNHLSNAEFTQRVLPQILLTYYYGQKRNYRSETSSSLKVWNQTKGLVETIYSSYTDVLDEGVVGKLLSKIERVLINEPFESYFR